MWDAIHHERIALADGEPVRRTADLTLAVQRLDSAADARAHDCDGEDDPPKFFAKMGGGFRFTSMSATQVNRESSGPAVQTLAEFRAHAMDSTVV